MARDGSGTYTRVSNSFSSPVSSTVISPTDAEAFFDELESEITDSLSRSGKGGMSADLDMNNNDINEIKTAVFQGSTSGNTTLQASATAGTTTLTLPAATDTLVGRATTDTLTNKTIAGATGGSAPATGSIGEYLSSVVAGTSPVAITSGANNVWNTLDITAGCWLVGGNAAVIKTGGTTPTFTHMHADHNASGSTTIATAPAGGSTIALHVDSNDPNGWCFPMGIRPYNVSTTTTVRAVMLPDFTGGTAGAYGVLWAVRIA